jgi:hypothetical protein
MAKRKQAKAAIPYLRRIVEDEYAQEQLREAATRLHEIYSRGSRKGSKAAEDKKLYAKAREAATSIRKAVGAIEEPPPKPKRRRRKGLVLALALAAALAAKRARGSKAPPADTHSDASGSFTPENQPQEDAEPIGASNRA